MYTLSAESHFDAAHRLSNYEGKCKRLHGHRWTVRIEVEGTDLNDWGAVTDFGDIKKLLNEELAFFDHRTILNASDPQNHELTLPAGWVAWLNGNPTAENVARYLYTALRLKIKGLGAELREVRVAESPTSYAKYTKN